MARPKVDHEPRIVALLVEGDLAEAATAIVRNYGPGILGYLAVTLRDDDAARDVFSEFAEELWKALPKFERRSSTRTWAYAIAYRCVLRHRRAAARRKTRPLRDSEFSRIAESARSLSASFSRTAAERKLDALRAALSPEEQTLLVLRVDREMSWDAVAIVLGEHGPGAAAALRKRFQRLKQRLRTLATKRG